MVIIAVTAAVSDAVLTLRQVQKLSSDNQRLQAESRQAAQQLRKFTQWFISNVEKP